MKILHLVAVALGVAASALAVSAVAVYEGYFPPSYVGNMTPGELGGVSALAVVGAAGAAYAERA